MGGFNNEVRNSLASIVLELLIKKYGIPQCGRNRATFISRNYVIKFPLNDNGEQDNKFERSFISDNTAKGENFDINGFSCLIQERLNLMDHQVNFDNLPEWVNAIDSNQVGYDFKGNLKAYDFADIKESIHKLNKVTGLIT